MSMTKPPADWHFYLTLPDPSDTEMISGKWQIDIDEPIAYAGQDFRFPCPLEIKVEGYWTKPHFFVSINIDGLVEVPCSRCLEKTEVAIKGQFSYLYGLASDREDTDNEEEDEIFVKLRSWKSVIDIVDQVWECLILLLPEKVLCSEDCKGLCPVCGQNLNKGTCNCNRDTSDPRLEVLKKFSEDPEE